MPSKFEAHFIPDQKSLLLSQLNTIDKRTLEAGPEDKNRIMLKQVITKVERI